MNLSFKEGKKYKVKYYGAGDTVKTDTLIFSNVEYHEYYDVYIFHNENNKLIDIAQDSFIEVTIK